MAIETKSPRELTLRGVALGAVLTVLFTAANVYLGLKIGLTFATSIPAAVISMALLKAFSDSSIQENNIVQTIASAAGTLSAIIFVLPGLIMIGWWTGFPYWLSVAVIAVGGILGVMYSVPLRRALVTGSDLPYPEGVAAAEDGRQRFAVRRQRVLPESRASGFPAKCTGPPCWTRATRCCAPASCGTTPGRMKRRPNWMATRCSGV